MNSIALYIAVFFALLGITFLILSATRGAAQARKVWRRVGIIFAAVALVLLAVRMR